MTRSSRMAGSSITGARKSCSLRNSTGKTRAYAREVYSPVLTAQKHAPPWSINLWGDDGLYWKVKGFIDDDLLVFGENLYGEHSIHYSKLKDYFHVFACYNETNDKWWSWDDVKFVSKVLGVPHVPTLWRGKAESEDQIKEIIFQTMNMPSAYGDTKEGVVMRVTDEFDGDEFPNYVCKYVRPNHVQTDEHWTRNWRKAQLITT